MTGTPANRLDSLCRRMNGGARDCALFIELESTYSNPPRAYHNLEHIYACLGQFDLARFLCDHPDEVEMAIWFHDAIYDPRRSDNEARSAELATTLLTERGLESDSRERIVGLILDTRHDRAPATQDGRILVDVDLSILGQPEDVFDSYEGAIREEYRHVSDDAFRAGRTAVLEQFLRRSRIYNTDYFFARYERSARENLNRSLTRLRDHGAQ